MEPFVPHSHKKKLIILFCENLRIKIFMFLSEFNMFSQFFMKKSIPV
jgi:hypothetical protein